MRGTSPHLRMLETDSNPLINVFLDVHKVYIDDEHYNSGYGHAYEKYGVDPKVGAVVIVRPDQCEYMAQTWDDNVSYLCVADDKRQMLLQ